MTEHEYDDSLADEEFIDPDVEIYEDAPQFDVSQTNEDDAQDEDDDAIAGLGLMAKIVNAIRTWAGALSWYRSHTTAQQIGFNPDGMCLKVCRMARNIPAKYLTAKEAQDATPEDHRVHAIRDLRRGMVLYHDDPSDSNRAGHITTLAGRVRGFDPDSLHDLLTWTNSVVPGKLVLVRGDYFQEHWGDKFKFGATILNGVELDVPGRTSRIERFNNGGPVYDLALLRKAAKAGRPKPGEILRRIEAQIKRLPDNPKLVRVREFKDEWKADDKIDLSLLDAAVREGRTGIVKQVRDEVKRLINALPDE